MKKTVIKKVIYEPKVKTSVANDIIKNLAPALKILAGK